MSGQVDGVSLKSLGLCMDDLECPEGGAHTVPRVQVVVAASAGGGQAICTKCRAHVTLRSL